MKKILIILAIFCLTLLLIILGCSSSNKMNIPIGKIYNEDSMKSLIDPPKNIPFLLRPIIRIADKKANKEMLTGRVLAWSPKISISSGLLELYIEDAAAVCLDKRMIKLLRIYISYTVPSPFAIDINSWNYSNFKITKEEIEGLQGNIDIDSINTFSNNEKIALKYARALSKTPIELNQSILDDLRLNFSENQILAIAALSAKVNYWTRLIEALRIKPAGYTNDSILRLEKYSTFVR